METPKPKTGAERQAAYRARRATAGANGQGDRKLSTYVSTGAHLALARLAAHRGTTRRAILERLLIEEDDRVSRTLEFDSPEWERYLRQEAPPKTRRP